MKKTTTNKAAKTTKVVKAKRAPKELSEKTLQRMNQALGFEEDEELDEEGGGKIESILKLYTKGFTKSEIVLYGFNRSTVYRQCGELDKYKKAPALKYYGHDLYEARIEKLMKAKKLTRAKAVEMIASKDLES